MVVLGEIINGTVHRLKRSKVGRWVVVGAVLVGLTLAFTQVSPALAASLIVNSTGNQSDTNPGNGICKIAGQNKCTLRAAMEEANAHAGADVITFAAALDGQTIAPATDLPALTANSTTIRGGGKITLDGGPGALAVGLYIHGGSSNKIQGLTLTNFGTAVKIEWGGPGMSLGNIVGTDGNGTADNQEGNVIGNNAANGVHLTGDSVQFTRVAGNRIGVNAAGTAAMPNTTGVRLDDGATSNIIGTNGNGQADAAERNIISGNTSVGVFMSDVSSNRIAGNYIGTNAAGNTGLGNGSAGMWLTGAVSGNVIGTNGDGTADAAERNVISANSNTTNNDQIGGILIVSSMVGVEPTLNTIAGNYIGLNAAGTAAIGNSGPGITLDVGTANNRVGTNGDGTADAAERNVISGNEGEGIFLLGGTSANTIAGNYVGTDAAGSVGLGNVGAGILIIGAAFGNRIGTNGDGTADVAERNVISDNTNGVVIRNSYDNIVAGNFIGTNAAGAAGLGNFDMGVWIFNPNASSTSTSANLIGGDLAAERNVIAYNGDDGVQVANFDTTTFPTENTIRANSIYSNGDLGINLRSVSDPPNPVTLNDLFDADSGANDVMNFPTLFWAKVSGGTITIKAAMVAGLPDTEFQFEFFSSPTCDSLYNYGEGQTYLGHATFVTNAVGNANAQLTYAKTVPVGHVITATATSSGNTSEFAPCVPVQQFTVQAKISVVKPFYSWSAMTGAESYNLVVNDSAGNVIDERFLAADICFEGVCAVSPDTALREGEPYAWRVRPVTPAGDGAFGKLHNFTVDLTPPDAPTPRLPGDGSFVSSTRPRFTWGQLPDVMRYHVQVATDPDFLHLVLDRLAADNEFTPRRVQALTRGEAFYWRVRAQDRAGSWGPFSPAFSFTVNR